MKSLRADNITLYNQTLKAVGISKGGISPEIIIFHVEGHTQEKKQRC